jgi:hypothetical protein
MCGYFRHDGFVLTPRLPIDLHHPQTEKPERPDEKERVPDPFAMFVCMTTPAPCATPKGNCEFALSRMDVRPVNHIKFPYTTGQ